jgi:acetyl/propionyl-CoA carboxylase alpha subunit
MCACAGGWLYQRGVRFEFIVDKDRNFYFLENEYTFCKVETSCSRKLITGV